MSYLVAGPEIGADTLTMRPYQSKAFDAVRREFRLGRKSTCVILPTGTGKTCLFAKIARAGVEKGRRVLILAHRSELIQQAADVLDRVGIVPGIEMADSNARAGFDPDVVVGSVATLQRRRLERWPADHFGLIVIDEAHHATAISYQRILSHFAKARVLGVTATPDRADEDEIALVFDSIAYEMTIWEAMTAPEPGPYLCRLKFVQCDVDIDLRHIRTTAGDFNQADVEERIRPLIETLANAVKKEIGDRQTLVFTPDVGSATAMATALQSLGLRADWISGESADRKEKVSRYRDGAIQVLANCNLLTEGFDAPATSAIVLCRPTKSRPLYSQQVGRGTRLSPGKEDCLLVDFNYLTDKHDLVRPADLFDSSGTDPAVIAIADELLRDEPGSDLIDVVEKAKAEQARREVLAIRARERDVKYRRRVSYDPLDAARVVGLHLRGAANAVFDPPSDKQCKYAESFGITNPETFSRRRLSRLLEVLQQRRDGNLATVKQVANLINNGIDSRVARAMSKAEASEALDRIWGGTRGQPAAQPSRPSGPPRPATCDDGGFDWATGQHTQAMEIR